MVVLGAHYDHVGVQKGKIYPGAEDNASGTALVLQVATALATDRRELGRSVLVLFFGSEELGLIGSKAFVRKPSLPLKGMAAMINVDMIGRALADRRDLRAGVALMGIHAASSVGVHGARGRPVLRRIVDEAFAGAGVRVVAAEDFPEPLAGIIEKQTAGRTDHSTFEKAGVPALFFTSAESDDYHEPTDTTDTLDPEVLSARARAIHRLVLELSRTPRADLGR
jgi:Zn-dependent M28 family amino/carboxypeptidase